MPNSLFGIWAKLLLSKLQTLPQALSPSAIYLYRSPWFNFWIGRIKVFTVVPSEVDTNISCMTNQMSFVELIGFDLLITVTYKFKLSGFQNLTHIINVFRWILLFTRTCSHHYMSFHWYIFTSAILELACSIICILHEPPFPVVLKIMMRGNRLIGTKIQSIYSKVTYLPCIFCKAMKRDECWAIQCENEWWKKSYIFIYLQLPILFISHLISRVGEVVTMISQVWTIMAETSCIYKYIRLHNWLIFCFFLNVFIIHFIQKWGGIGIYSRIHSLSQVTYIFEYWSDLELLFLIPNLGSGFLACLQCM